jgi:hypothetical protein
MENHTIFNGKIHYKSMVHHWDQNWTHNFQTSAAPGLCDHPIAEGKTHRIEAKGLDPLEVGLQ